jgi:hypothetical protein
MAIRGKSADCGVISGEQDSSFGATAFSSRGTITRTCDRHHCRFFIAAVGYLQIQKARVAAILTPQFDARRFFLLSLLTLSHRN